MDQFDYIIAGAGSAGCVLANRLSEEPGVRVLLLEAGGEDKSPMVKMPKGYGKLLGDSKYTWHFPTRPFGPTGKVEAWARGKTLGGSSSINGLVYNRGQRADWDTFDDLGHPAFAWDSILPIYRRMEGNRLGRSDTRGSDGPLTISTIDRPGDLCEEMVASGSAVGMRHVEDVNESDDERIGYAMATMADGRRVSAADAFLHPVRGRDNLRVEVGTLVTNLTFEGDRVVGVQARQGDQTVEFGAAREVILSLGSLQTPRVLQLSGIGPSETLRSAGIDVRVDAPNVGARLREHRCFTLQYRLKDNVGYNKTLGSPLGQGVSALRYFVGRKGPLTIPSYDVIGFLRTDPSQERVDAQVLMAPFSVAAYEAGENPSLEREPGVQCIGYVLRPTSEGSVHITADDPSAPLDIVPNYYASDRDRTTGLALFARMREMFAADPIADHLVAETLPGTETQDDQAIIDMALEHGFCGYHAIGTAAMGHEETDPVDSELRVRGVENLRVMDCSVLPEMVSGNLNGPMMAMAWRAADLIREGC